MMRRLTALLLCMVLLSAGLTGCTSAKATDLMTGVQPGDRKTSIDVTGPEAAAVTDFAVRLLQNLPSGEENTLLSPVSVLCALAMTENGAKGETLSQMETVFGLDLATAPGRQVPAQPGQFHLAAGRRALNGGTGVPANQRRLVRRGRIQSAV